MEQSVFLGGLRSVSRQARLKQSVCLSVLAGLPEPAAVQPSQSALLAFGLWVW